MAWVSCHIFSDKAKAKQKAKEGDKSSEEQGNDNEQSLNTSRDKQLPLGQSGSSFQAFTDTVDALALQESVIGEHLSHFYTDLILIEGNSHYQSTNVHHIYTMFMITMYS